MTLTNCHIDLIPFVVSEDTAVLVIFAINKEIIYNLLIFYDFFDDVQIICGLSIRIKQLY